MKRNADYIKAFLICDEAITLTVLLFFAGVTLCRHNNQNVKNKIALATFTVSMTASALKLQ